jgi:hypothetical protein
MNTQKSAKWVIQNSWLKRKSVVKKKELHGVILATTGISIALVLRTFLLELWLQLLELWSLYNELKLE